MPIYLEHPEGHRYDESAKVGTFIVCLFFISPILIGILWYIDLLDKIFILEKSILNFIISYALISIFLTVGYHVLIKWLNKIHENSRIRRNIETLKKLPAQLQEDAINYKARFITSFNDSERVKYYQSINREKDYPPSIEDYEIQQRLEKENLKVEQRQIKLEQQEEYSAKLLSFCKKDIELYLNKYGSKLISVEKAIFGCKNAK